MTQTAGPRPAPKSFTRLAPCHCEGLFVKNDGWVYPCCLVGGGDGAVKDFAHMIIGHVTDPDLPRRIEHFTAECRCEGQRLRPASPGEPRRYGRLNLELSLSCQAHCAMCCVFAPEFRGSYDLYGHIERLVDFCSPREILFQGGEVLVQPNTLRWIASLRRRLPDTRFMLATNGSVDARRVPEVESLFDALHFSIVGFQPQTYKSIMGLDLARTKRFARSLCERGKCYVQLKFMATPNNIHEIPLFLEWAAKTGPANIAVEGIGVLQYVVLDTFDDYWSKIFARAGRAVEKCLARLRGGLEQRGIELHIATEVAGLLGLNRPGAEAEKDDPERLLIQARTLALGNGKERATRILAALGGAALGPDDPRARIVQALAAEDEPGPRSAEILRGVLGQHPGHPDVLDILDRWCDQAWPHIDREDYPPAQALLERVLAVREDHPKAAVALAVIDLKREQYGPGLARIGRALAAHPQIAELALMEATILARSGEHARAIEKLDALLSRRPWLYTAHLSQSDIHRYAGEFDRALACLEKALAIHPRIKGLQAKKDRLLELRAKAGRDATS